MTRGGKFYVLWLAALAVAVCLGGLASSDGLAAAGSQKKARRPTRQTARARTLFKQNCAECHGADGKSHTLKGEMMGAPNFTAAWWWAGVSDKRLNASITHGRGRMPSFGNKLSSNQVKLLVAYVRGFNRQPARR
jgi:cbb3-type cytochrome c oxidase subunit III